MAEKEARDRILGAADIKTAKVETPEWASADMPAVFVRVISAAERDEYDTTLLTGEGEERKVDYVNMRAKFCVYVLSDEQGNRLFQNGDAAELGKKSGVVLDRIYNAGQRINLMHREAVEETRKNS